MARFLSRDDRSADPQARMAEIERENAELRETLRLEGSLSQHTRDYVFTIDPAGNFLDVNPAIERDYGYSREQFQRMHMSQLVDPAQLARVTKLLAARLAGTHEVDLVEILTRTRAGDPLTVQLRTHRLYDADGTVRGLQGIAHGVSEENERQLRAVVNEAAEAIGIVDDEKSRVAPDRAPTPFPLVDEMAEAILVTDENDDIVDANPRACELLGYGRNELIGRHLPDMETDPAQVGPRVRAARAGRPAHIEHRVIGKGGEILELESIFAEIRDGRRLSSHRDISPRLEIEAALQRSERRYRSLVTNATDLIFELDLSGRILFANSASQTLLGYSAADLRALPFADLAADQTPSGRGAVSGWLQSAGQAGSLELEARRKDGTIIWLDVAGRRVDDAAGRPPTIVGIARDVTTAKFAEQVTDQARAVLARGDAQLRTALAPLPMMVFSFDADGRVIFAEGRVLDWIGVESGVLAAQPIEAAPRMKAELRDGYERAMQGHDVDQVWHQNGLTMDLRYVPRRQGGEIIGVVGLGFDTTERERQQQELARSRASLQRAQEAAQLGSWEVDTTTLGLTASDQARRIFGLRPDGEGEPLTAEDFWGRVHPDDLDGVRESFVAGGRAGQPSYLEHRILQPDGEVRHVALRSERIVDEQGSITRVAGVVQDITERQRTIEALQASEQQLRSLVRTAPVIIFATDADGVFTMTDGKGLEEIDFAPDLRVGASALESQTASLGEAVARALGGEELSDTFELGGLLFDHHYTPKRDARGEITGVVGVCVNVHEQRRLEAQLRQAKKMEAVGRLAGGIAHDFNNVLSVITGYTELALLSVEESDPLYESLGEIRQAGQSAAALTRQLLAFSRRQVLEPEIVNLAEVVAELEPMLRRIIEEDVQIETDLNPIGCTVQADPGQIEQVIMNLVVNARDAMTDGGTITVRAEAVESPAGLSGPCVMLAVSDEGHGMDAETRERVFEPFFTTKDVGEGTGLGLATVYGIVSQSDGAIELDSEPGQGASFRVYFPAAPPLGDDARDEEPAQLPRGSERILLVEDEDAVRGIVERLLLHCGYNVCTAISGQDALDLVAREDLDLDLLFTDIVMPGMRGPELARRMREIDPSLRVLFTSGYVDNEPVELDSQGPGAAYLQKPVGHADIARKVREVLDAPAFEASSAESEPDWSGPDPKAT